MDVPKVLPLLVDFKVHVDIEWSRSVCFHLSLHFKLKTFKAAQKSSNSKFEMNLFTGWPSSSHTYNIVQYYLLFAQINIDVRLRQSYPIYNNK